jgi:hypothetical protein
LTPQRRREKSDRAVAMPMEIVEQMVDKLLAGTRSVF